MRSVGALLLVFAAALAAGCDPPFFIHGSVRSGSAPVPGAAVTLTCGSDERPLGSTDARGQFAYHSIPGESPDCRVTITKAGHPSRSLRLGDVCTHHFGASCTEASFSSDLAPIR